jgi:protein gp37
MAQSAIEWTDATWNPTTGCTKISAGCKFCYAEVLSRRLQAMGQNKYINGFQLTMHPETLQLPYQWKNPKVIFVNSMSDLFHDDIPQSYIQEVFNVMNDNRHHVFQILTKRAERLSELSPQLNWGTNIWMGVTIEREDYKYRADLLRNIGAEIKFISCEPLIGPINDLNLEDIDWLIAGGESGRTPRPIEKTWVESLQYQCESKNVAFFFKQWGGTNKKKNGRSLNRQKIYRMFTNFIYTLCR